MSEEDESIEKEVLSPIISEISWGSIEIEGIGKFKDAKLYPDGAQEWNWLDTKTHHVPGILPADVQDLLDRKCEIIVLSKGMQDKLETSEETYNLFKEKNMKNDEHYFILSTKEAVNRYNELAQEKKRVGALIHSTC